MLVRKQNTLVPHDIDLSLLDFVLRNDGDTRFLINIFIPEAENNKFYYDTGHIVLRNGELKVHSQQNSYPYALHMYAWNHVYCLAPSAKRNRKVGAGWIAPNAELVMEHPNFKNTWHSKEVREFIEADRNSH